MSDSSLWIAAEGATPQGFEARIRSKAAATHRRTTPRYTVWRESTARVLAGDVHRFGLKSGLR
eukprot:9477927-Pyramimonas_sp.AAC.5